MKKRIISILLTVLMIVSMIPLAAVPAFAEDEPDTLTLREILGTFGGTYSGQGTGGAVAQGGNVTFDAIFLLHSRNIANEVRFEYGDMFIYGEKERYDAESKESWKTSINLSGVTYGDPTTDKTITIEDILNAPVVLTESETNIEFSNMLMGNVSTIVPAESYYCEALNSYFFTTEEGLKKINFAGIELTCEDEPTITVNSTGHGTVSVPSSAAIGDTVTLTAIPNEGYVLEASSLSVCPADFSTDDLELTWVEGTTYTFTMPDRDVIVEATFVEKEEKEMTLADIIDKVGGTYIGETTAEKLNGNWHITKKIYVGEDAVISETIEIPVTEPDVLDSRKPSAEKIVVDETGMKLWESEIFENGAPIYGDSFTSSQTIAYYLASSVKMTKADGDDPVPTGSYNSTSLGYFYEMQDGLTQKLYADGVVLERADKAIIVTPAEHGTVTAKPSANEGDEVTVTVTPDEGYELKDGGLTVKYYDDVKAEIETVPLTPGENGTYTFIMPAAKVTVTAEFGEEDTPIDTVNLSVGNFTGIDAPVTVTVPTGAPYETTLSGQFYFDCGENAYLYDCDCKYWQVWGDNGWEDVSTGTVPDVSAPDHVIVGINVDPDFLNTGRYFTDATMVICNGRTIPRANDMNLVDPRVESWYSVPIDGKYPALSMFVDILATPETLTLRDILGKVGGTYTGINSSGTSITITISSNEISQVSIYPDGSAERTIAGNTGTKIWYTETLVNGQPVFDDEDYTEFKDVTIETSLNLEVEILTENVIVDDVTVIPAGSYVVGGEMVFYNEQNGVTQNLLYLGAVFNRIGGIEHEHTFADEYSSNEAVHWLAATCEHTELSKNLGEHTFGTDGRCTVCGYEKQADALTEAKNTAKAEIDAAVDGASDEIKNYAATAKEKIDACADITAVIQTLVKELDTIDAMKTQKAIAAALAELDNAAKNAVANKSKAIAQAAKPLIDNAKSAEEANAVLSEALTKIAGEEKTLSDAKTAAKAAVDSAAGSKQSEAMKKIVSEVKAAIDNAKSTDEVAKAQQEGTARIEAQKEAEKPTEPTDPGSGSFLNRLLQQIRNIFKNIFDTLFGWLPFC